MQVRVRYVRAYRDNRGKERIYYRRPGQPQVKLRGPLGSPAFLEDYNRAHAASQPPTLRAPLSGSLEALSLLWLASPKFQAMAPSTQAVQRRILDRLRKEHGHRIVRDATERDVRRLVQERQDTPAAANHVLRLLRGLFAHAVKENWRTDNPAKGVERLAERQKGHPDWPDEEIARYRAHWPVGSKPRLAFELLIQTAQRKGDVIGLGRQHLRSGGTLLRFRQEKTGTDMTLPVTPDLAACLSLLPDGQMVFLLTEAGAAYSRNGFYNSFRDWCDEAGIPKGYSPHGLRKARARLLAEDGATAHEIGAWTGHKTLAEVERYTRAADQERMAHAALAKAKPRTGNG
ncbi:tyrosine-type recombinase/integrase [Muricoccus nepalensis]|nr:tyrosine-type recombinase/integrase [Roseomonas nepalensis]